ncbi:MAG TPA: hypothetical protein VL523_09030 [Terriglobia bacterium]|nr:hypothetical protein [Terriglobia bacterium]
MAVTRTILARKGLIQSQHGLTGYEADQDANWALLDAKVAFVSDLQFPDLGINGVVYGFALSVSSTLVPGLAPGILYAQGVRYAAASAPAVAAAPANGTSYLFYNSVSGFYYFPGPAGAALGDALLGRVVASANAVSAVTAATRVFGYVSAAPGGAGNFAVPHMLGRTPVGAVILMTSGGSIWFQPSPLFDASNLYLTASGDGATAAIQVW